MPLISELKRRKVFKMGAACLVVVWLVGDARYAALMKKMGLPE